MPITSVSTQSNLDSANTAVVNAEAGVAAAEHNLESAKAATQQAEANAAKSDADLVRYRQLVTKDDISHQQYDQAEAAAVGNEPRSHPRRQQSWHQSRHFGKRRESSSRQGPTYVVRRRRRSRFRPRAPRQKLTMRRCCTAKRSSTRRTSISATPLSGLPLRESQARRAFKLDRTSVLDKNS